MGYDETSNEPPVLSFTVLLPMRNEGTLVERKITEVIMEIADSENTELLVVNSSSTDDTKELALKTLRHSELPPSRWSVIDCEAPGKTRAVNLALSRIDTDLVMMMDSDSISPKGWLRTCHEIFMDSEIGLVCGIKDQGDGDNSKSLESIYRKYSNNRRIAHSTSSSIVIAEGSMCCFRKIALGGRKLNENYNADDTQIAILCSKNNFRSIVDARLSFFEPQTMTWSSNFRRRIRRGRGLTNALVRNVAMSFPVVNPINPLVFARSFALYLLVPWISIASLILSTFTLFFPEILPILIEPMLLRAISTIIFSVFVLWPTGRSIFEGSVIMVIAQATSLFNPNKDAWLPDRQGE